jgi:hypothetical protein
MEAVLRGARSRGTIDRHRAPSSRRAPVYRRADPTSAALCLTTALGAHPFTGVQTQPRLRCVSRPLSGAIPSTNGAAVHTGAAKSRWLSATRRLSVR